MLCHLAYLAWEKDKMKHLAYKWVGNAPIQCDVDHITRFMGNAGGMFHLKLVVAFLEDHTREIGYGNNCNSRRL